MPRKTSWRQRSTGMGQATSSQVREEFARRVRAGEFRLVENVGTGPQYTTAAMLRLERETIGHMQEGNRRGYSDRCWFGPIFVSLRRSATRS